MKSANFLFLFLAWFAIASPASAQADLNGLAAKASGSRLDLGVQPYAPNLAVVRAFRERFPKIDVRMTQMSVSMFASRVVMEQKGGIFAWDSFFGQILNAADVLVPSGGVAKITDYLVLPEVKDPAQWRSSRFLYSPEGEPYIFNFGTAVESSFYINTAALKDFRFTKAEDLLDPKLKGRIAIRMADRSGAGAITLATLYQSHGADFVRRLLTETGATFYENPRQITTALMRGEKAIALGAGATDILGVCQMNGGCRGIVESPLGSVVLPRGVFVLKNAPHKPAATLWVNWLLSREGQSIYVREWAKSFTNGAVSMRKDVAPARGHEASLPDFDHPEKYLFLGTKNTERLRREAVALFREAQAKRR